MSENIDLINALEKRIAALEARLDGTFEVLITSKDFKSYAFSDGDEGISVACEIWHKLPNRWKRSAEVVQRLGAERLDFAVFFR